MKELREIVSDFANAWKLVDADKPVGHSKTRIYSPGLGPLTESRAIELAVEKLRASDSYYSNAAPAAYPGERTRCDLVIPGDWAIELKLARPFGDNGVEAEHWSENIVHPYPGNVSAVGDAYKLAGSNFLEQVGIIIFGYEHEPAVIELEAAICSFERILESVTPVQISERAQQVVTGLCHPCHQTLKIYAWEVLRSVESRSDLMR